MIFLLIFFFEFICVLLLSVVIHVVDGVQSSLQTIFSLLRRIALHALLCNFQSLQGQVFVVQILDRTDIIVAQIFFCHFR